MRKNNLVTSLIVIAVMAMTSGVSSAGFIRFKKSVAKTPAAPALNPVSPPSSSTPADSVPPLIRGTYKFLCIGTGGPDALEPGNDGVVTVSADGKVSGTLYYYEDGSTGILSGTINQTQSTGEGSATLRNSRRGWTGYYTFTAKVTSKQYSVLQGEYKEVGSTSKGIFWCIQDAP
jgi:hypothetical protein